MIKVNVEYTILFAATVAGVGTAADSTPTAVLWRNGSASGVSVTVSTTAQTGLYKAVFTTDSGWSASDYLELYATATIAGTAGYLAKVWSSTEIGAAELDSDTLNKLDAILEDTSTTLPAQIGTPVGASVSADIAAVKADTATLLERVSTAVAALWANLIAMITGSGPTAAWSATAMANAPAGGGGSTTISDEDIQEIVAGVTAVAPRICDSSAGTFRMTAGDTWIQDFTVTTTGADKFIVAVKNDAADADTAAVLLIDSADGLERINGAVPSNAGDASIATGAATITATVQSNITLMIVPGKYVVTVKKLDVGSDVTAISTASLTVFAPGVSEIST
jgi:hypothetical protein